MWVALRLVGLGRADLPRVVTMLQAHGTVGLQEEWLPGLAPPPRQPWDDGAEPYDPDPMVLTAWFDGEVNRSAVTSSVSRLALEAHWDEVAEEDWSSMWRRGFETVVIGRIKIAPPWEVVPGAVVIEPGIGFGTGHHPTTRQVLAALDRLAIPPRRAVLDVGCGSGILALAAARLGLAATGIDIEADAVVRARAHARQNQLDATFDTRPLAEVQGHYDLVLANVHAEALCELAPHLVRLTSDRLVVAGILKHKEASVLHALEPLRVSERTQGAGWVCLELHP